mgnify:CR=1 FL=1
MKNIYFKNSTPSGLIVNVGRNPGFNPGLFILNPFGVGREIDSLSTIFRGTNSSPPGLVVNASRYHGFNPGLFKLNSSGVGHYFFPIPYLQRKPFKFKCLKIIAEHACSGRMVIECARVE